MPFNQEYRPCFLSGRPAVNRHHVFEGNGRRALSEKYGLVCDLSYEEHREVHDHPKGEKAMMLKVWAQNKFEKEHGTREDFIRIFQTNVLE